MAKKEYNKLVRDLIPDRLTKKGLQFESHVLSEDVFREKLRDKLAEESQEIVEATTTDDLIAELADLQEVLLALYATESIDVEEVEKIRLKKREERGGFDQRVFLDWVEE